MFVLTFEEINAWMFEGYEDAKIALMEALLKTMESNEKIKAKVGKEIKGLYLLLFLLLNLHTVYKKAYQAHLHYLST